MCDACRYSTDPDDHRAGCDCSRCERQNAQHNYGEKVTAPKAGCGCFYCERLRARGKEL